MASGLKRVILSGVFTLLTLPTPRKTSTHQNLKTFRVNFTGFGEHFLNIEIHSYIDTVDIVEFNNISEDLNLHILDIIQSAGTRIAIPANIEYHEQENVSSPDSKQQAEQRVETFRTNSKQ